MERESEREFVCERRRRVRQTERRETEKEQEIERD